MAENTLVEGLWADSVELIKKLDEGEYSPTLAVWYFYADAEQWRLLIGGPAYDALLPKQEPPINESRRQSRLVTSQRLAYLW